MALCARLCTRTLPRLQRTYPLACIQKRTALSARPYKLPEDESYDEKNMRLCRPLSPHLTIYKFQLTALLSITHRFTGIALTGCLGVIGVTSIAYGSSVAGLIEHMSTNMPVLLMLFKLGLVFPFSYHFFNGIRHLIWDSGKSLTIDGVYISGYLMLAAAAVSAATLIYF